MRVLRTWRATPVLAVLVPAWIALASAADAEPQDTDPREPVEERTGGALHAGAPADRLRLERLVANAPRPLS